MAWGRNFSLGGGRAPDPRQQAKNLHYANIEYYTEALKEKREQEKKALQENLAAKGIVTEQQKQDYFEKVQRDREFSRYLQSEEYNKGLDEYVETFKQSHPDFKGNALQMRAKAHAEYQRIAQEQKFGGGGFRKFGAEPTSFVSVGPEGNKHAIPVQWLK